MRYKYPVVITRDENNSNLFNVVYPDIQGCYTCCTEDRIMEEAKELLRLHIKAHTKKISPTPLEELKQKFPYSYIKEMEVFINE